MARASLLSVFCLSMIHVVISVTVKANVGRFFVYPILRKDYFPLVNLASVAPIEFQSSSFGGVTLPSWLNFMQSEDTNNAYLYGTPDSPGDDKINLQVIGLDRLSYDTTKEKVIIELYDKKVSLPYYIDLPLVNISLEQLLEGDNLSTLTYIVQQLWTRGEVMPTKVISPIPYSKSGVLIRFSGSKHFSTKLRLLATHPSSAACQGQGQPQVGVEKDFLPRFHVDWCGIVLILKMDLGAERPRRSQRKKTSKQDIDIKEAIYFCQLGQDKEGFCIKFINDEIGRGIFATKDFDEETFLLEYCGDLISRKEGLKREKMYTVEDGNFLFFFRDSVTNKIMCVDATLDPFDLRKGRLVNDGTGEKANCRMVVIVCENAPHLCLFSTKRIRKGEELRFDYGVPNLPWRKKRTETGQATEDFRIDGVRDGKQTDELVRAGPNVYANGTKASKQDSDNYNLNERLTDEVTMDTATEEIADNNPVREGLTDGVTMDTATEEIADNNPVREGLTDGVTMDTATEEIADNNPVREGLTDGVTMDTAREEIADNNPVREGLTDGVTMDTATEEIADNNPVREGLTDGVTMDTATEEIADNNPVREGLTDGVTMDTVMEEIADNNPVREGLTDGVTMDTATEESADNNPVREGLTDGVTMDTATEEIADNNPVREGLTDGVTMDTATEEIADNNLVREGLTDGVTMDNATEEISHKQALKEGSKNGGQLYLQHDDCTQSEISDSEESVFEDSTDEYVCPSASDETDGSEEFPFIHIPSPIGQENNRKILCKSNENTEQLPNECYKEFPPSQSICSDKEVQKDNSCPSKSPNSIDVCTTNNADGRTYDKKYYCPYCGNPQAKLPRHLMSKHKNEIEVVQYSIEKDKTKKSNMMSKLRNLGNHLHNVDVLQKCSGNLVVSYRPSESVSYTSYVPCEYCLGYYVHWDLWKHVRRCPLAKKETKGKKHFTQQGRLLLPTPLGTSEGLRTVLVAMKSDEIGMCCRSDWLILKLGEKLFLKHGHDQEQFGYIRNTLRELARLVLKLRETYGPNSASLSNFIHPKRFMSVVECARAVAGFTSKTNLYQTPSLALKIGHSVKKCAGILKGLALQSGDNCLRDEASSFIELCELNWTEEVSTHALRTLSEKKRNKIKLIPLTEDVKRLSSYLKSVAEESFELLQNNNTVEAWSALNEATLAEIILFNRRRQGEASKMTLTDYHGTHSTKHPDIEQGLSPLEQKLCDTLLRVEIIGKRGRVVPVILTDTMRKWIDILIQKREAVGVNESNKFIFARPFYGSLGHVRGSDCLRNASEKCGAKYPELLRSTKLRKQIGTLSQILNLKKHDLDILANFLGHDITVHREFYRLPEETVQVAKVSKLLIAMESGQLTNQAGKNLDEIEVELEEEIEGNLSDDESEEDEPDTMETARQQKKQLSPGMKMNSKSLTKTPKGDMPSTSHDETDRAGQAAKKKPWSEGQRLAVMRHFDEHILRLRNARKDEIMKCIMQEPVLKGRTWRNIKDFVRNKIETRKRKYGKFS